MHYVTLLKLWCLVASAVMTTQPLISPSIVQEIRNLWYEYGQGRYHVDASLRSNLDTSAADDESAHATKRFVG